MKKAAFFQALIILVLLGVSWVLIILKFKGKEETQGNEGSRIDTQETQPSEEPDTFDNEVTQAMEEELMPNPPEAWSEWVNYIRSQPNAALRRQAIEELRVSLSGISNDELVARLIQFLDSAYDFPTGLRFQTAKAGTLAGASSFRAMVLDWLGQLDPQAAAQLAMKDLGSAGTGMHPDEFVIHLRNYAWGTPADSNSSFLRQHFNLLVDQQDWFSNPTASIGEAMDIAVYLQDTSLVPELASIAQPGQNNNLRHAANLALERLFEIDPTGAAAEILQSTQGLDLDGRNRASLLARLDPATAEAKELIESYILSPGVTPAEFELFIQYLPNLNISYSYNLLSPEKPITQSIHHTERLRNALDMIEAWQNDPRFSQHVDLLSERIETMTVQLYGNPGP
ncbi:MAG: hypothetical protein AB3N63_08175 [Puniceicoccaceae bacterium]